jgi:hypothetical protein
MMIELKNTELRLDVLDPVADHARLGPRFCGGGFIWQVSDPIVGPLLSGPEWPHPAPAAFNGQGLPESFRHRTLDGRPLTWRGETGVALGAGELRAMPDGRVELVAPCRWTITSAPAWIEFVTDHHAAGSHYAIQRRIELEGRTVRSLTRLTNLSPDSDLMLEWFAHPFFPLVDGLVGAKMASNAVLPDNPGFALRDGTLVQKRRFASPTDGHMDRGLLLPRDSPFRATLKHPSVAEVSFETSFVPDACVIWGNDRTFSFEPYLTLHLAPGVTRDWWLSYRFGASSGIATPDATSR